MRKTCRGSMTIEAAVIVPLILMVFAVMVNVLFYVHDKNVIGAAAYETAAMGSSREKMDVDSLESYFQKRIRGRMFLFRSVDAEVTLEDAEVKVVCEAKKQRMKVSLERSMKRTDPEGYIRNIRKVEKLGGTLVE